MFPSSAILDIIILIFYFPALLIAIYVGLKHGFAKSAGWYQLNLLSIFRLLGSILGLVAIYQYSIGVLVASLTFSSMGTISLVGALLGLVGRANQSLKDKAINPRVIKLTQLITLVAIIIAIVGGTKVSSSDPDTSASGHTLAKVAIILIVVLYAFSILICAHTIAHKHLMVKGEKRLLYVSIASLPFILVRLVYAMCATVMYNNSSFNSASTTNTAVIIRAVMGLLMEIIVVSLFLWAGCTVDRSAEREAIRAEQHSANGTFQGRFGPVHESYVGKQEDGTTRV